MFPARLRAGVFLVSGLTLLSLSGCSKQMRVNHRLARGDKAFADGKYDLAEDYYRAARAADQESGRAAERLGTLYLREGRLVQAYVLLRKANAALPNDPDTKLSYALISLTVARTVEARDAAKVVLKSRPTNEEALLVLADSTLTPADEKETTALIDRLSAAHPGVPAYLVARGALKLIHRDAAGAESLFQAALQMDPKNGAAQTELGMVARQRGDVKALRAALQAASADSPLRSPHRLPYIEFLMQLREYDAAAIEAAKFTQGAPDFLPAWIYAMHIAFAQAKYEACLSYAKQILDRDGLNYDAMMQQAMVKLAQHDVPGELALLKQIDHNYNRMAEVKYQLALAYIKLDDFDAAEASVRQAIFLHPAYEQAVLLNAELTINKGNPAAALDALKGLLRKRRGDVQIYLLLGRAYERSGDFAEALSIYQQLQKVRPKDPISSYLSALVFLEQKDPRKARQALEQALVASPDFLPAIELLINADLSEHHAEAADRRAAQLVRRRPKLAAAWVLQAKTASALGREDVAQEALSQSIQIDPTLEPAYLQLARVFWRLKDRTAATERLRKLADQSHTSSALMQYAMILSAQGRTEEAHSMYEKLLKIDPHFAPALNNLAVLNSEQYHRYGIAFDEATVARQIAPEDPVIADTLAWVLFRQGKYSAAMPLVAKAAEDAPGEPEVQYHLGMVHYYLGDEGPAAAAFRQVLGSPDAGAMGDDARRRLSFLAIDPATAEAPAFAVLAREAQTDPADPVLQERLGELFERAGRWHEAADSFEAAARINRSLRALLGLVRIYSGPLADAAKTRAAAKTAHVLAPDDPTVTAALAKALYAVRDYTGAADLYDELGRQAPDQPSPLYQQARALYHAGKLDDADAAVQRALTLNVPFPEHDEAQVMADMLSASHAPEQFATIAAEAERDFTQHPDHLASLMMVASSAEHDGEYHRAESLYLQALKAEPGFALADRELALLYAEHLSDDEQAAYHANRAGRALAGDSQLMFVEGLIAYHRADFTNAVRAFQQTVREQQDSADAHFYLGMAQYQLKDNVQARENLTRSLELHLSDAEAAQVRRVLEALSAQSGTGG